MNVWRNTIKSNCGSKIFSSLVTKQATDPMETHEELREEPILRLGMPNPLPTSFFLPQRKSWPPAGGSIGRSAQTGWHRNQTDRELGKEKLWVCSLHGPISSWLASVPLAPGSYSCVGRKVGLQRRIISNLMPLWLEDGRAILVIKISDSW